MTIIRAAVYRYVAPPSEQEKFRMESEIHKLIISRAPISRARGEKIQFTNFVEVRRS